MIDAVIRWSIGNRVLVVVLGLLLAVGGGYALRQTPLDAIPDLSDVQVIIKTRFPGQAPQVVEDQVTYPLTTAMLAVPKAVSVRGYSFFGDSYVYVIFEDGTDLYWARSRVLEYLSQVAGELPPSASPELGPDATGVGWVYQYALVDRTGAHDIADLTSLQNWFLKFELQSVPGVAEVATVGGMVRQYQISLDPEKLRIFNLTLNEVRQAVQRGNQEVGGSVIELGEAEYMIRARGYVQGLDDLKRIPIGRLSQGTPLYLGDIADLSIGPQMRRGLGELSGAGEVVGGVIVMRWGENALKTIAGVKAKLNELKPGLPAGVQIVETYDRSALIERAVANLSGKLTEELAIVVLVCALFLLHLRSSLVIMVSLPIGILTAFGIMYLQGINANIMSLGGIAIAIGTMVDGAIVMIEALHQRLGGTRPSTQERWDAVSAAAREVGPPIFFSLLIITLSFLPVFTLEAQEGRLFKPLAFTKTYAMASACVLAITLVPVLMGYFVRGRVRAFDENPINRWLTRAYTPLITAAMRNPRAVLALALVASLSLVYPAARIGSEFMPELDEGDLLYMPSTFPGISIGKTQQILQQTNKLIMQVPEVAEAYGKAGRADTATDPAPMTMIETIVRLKPRAQWRPGITTDDIRAELDRLVQIPGVSNVWVMPIKNRTDMLATGIKTPVGIKIAGADLDVIARIGTDIETILQGVQGTASVYAERVTGGRYVEVDVRRTAAARYGMNVADVQDVVSSAIGGANVTTSVEGLERYPVNLRFPRDYRDSVERLRSLPVVTVSGAHVPLSDLADIRITDGPPMIRSENARQNGWVYVDIKGADLGSYVQTARRAVAEQLTLPPGYSLSWSGQFQYLERAQARLAVIVPITLILIVGILFLVFSRVIDVALVLLGLPLALTAGLWLMYLLGYQMSVAAGVGFIALSGLAVETNVVMLVYLKRAWDQVNQQTDDVRPALITAAGQRLRPILMTAATIVIGLFPVMLGSGTGSEVMRRIAAPMIGGVLGAVVLTLLVLPPMYCAWRVRLRDRQSATAGAVPTRLPAESGSGDGT